MSLGLIKPGMRSANLAGKIHPKTGEPLEPIGFLRDGTAVWPQMGAASDDPDDPDFQDPDDDPDDEDEDENEDDDSSKSKKKTVKKKTDKDDDEDDEEDEDDKPSRPERQAARYRVKLRESEKRERALADRLKALEDKDKPADEIKAREAREASEKAERLAAQNRSLVLENAFFKANTVDWVDAADALRLVDLDDVEIDEDGTVDSKALRAALKDLAKRKPHLVKKSKAAPDTDDEEDDDDEEPRSRRTAPTMNRRKTRKSPTRAELARKFPVLGSGR